MPLTDCNEVKESCQPVATHETLRSLLPQQLRGITEIIHTGAGSYAGCRASWPTTISRDIENNTRFGDEEAHREQSIGGAHTGNGDLLILSYLEDITSALNLLTFDWRGNSRRAPKSRPAVCHLVPYQLSPGFLP